MSHQQHHPYAGGGDGLADFFLLWSPEIILLTILIAAAYLLVVGPMRRHFHHSTPVTAQQKASFLLGLLFFYIAQGSPLNYYGHQYLFSAHMVQQSFLYLAMPPLLLIGTPEWLLQPLFKNHTAKRILSFFTHPIIGVLSFNLLFSFYHFPVIFDLIAKHHQWMTLYHFILVLAAFQMWWPIVSPLSEQKRLSDLRKIAYLFANGVLITPACALIIFSDTLLYATYANAPEIIPGHTAFDDQRLGGVLMKLIQEGVYGSVLAYTFYKWYSKEKGTDIDLPDNARPQMGTLSGRD
jgi:putative membrane protein